MNVVKALAFDCFGTVFDFKNFSRAEIKAYSDHVHNPNRNGFYRFSGMWYQLQAHPDAAPGIDLLRRKGYYCCTLSNGPSYLLEPLSEKAGIKWDKIIPLEKYEVYKPTELDAYRTVEKETPYKLSDFMMVTANPTFGDVEAATELGMVPQVIRHENTPATIIELAESLP